MAKAKIKECKIVPSDKLMEYVHFANFSQEYKIPAYSLAQLIILARRRYNAQVKLCNGFSARAEFEELKSRQAFEALAKEYKFKVSWSGLAPSLKYGKYDAHLPSPF